MVISPTYFIQIFPFNFTHIKERKQLTDEINEKKGYWKLKEETLDRTAFRTGLGRGYGLVERQTKE